MDRRHNWKEDIGKAAHARSEKRKALLVEKELLDREIHSLTIAEVRSDKYVQLKLRQAETIAKLATL